MAVEGKAPFQTRFAPKDVSTPCYTYYKIFGDLTDTTKIPLLVLHGGPAAGHEYLLGLHTLAEQVIFYDQLGCGQSTDLPEKHGDKDFWTEALFCSELSNLMEHLGLRNRRIDLLGHSWGGMLAVGWVSAFCTFTPTSNIRRLILYGVPASMELHVQGLAKVREGLPQDVQEALQHGLDIQDYTSPEFQNAMLVFCKRHLSLSSPFPIDEIAPALARMAGSEVHRTMFGPTTLVPSGSLQNWSAIASLLRAIKAPTLLIRGSEEYIQESAMQPFFDCMPKIKWITFNGAAHFAHIEQPEKFFFQVKRFLTFE